MATETCGCGGEFVVAKVMDGARVPAILAVIATLNGNQYPGTLSR
jgi:hypothetical protein